MLHNLHHITRNVLLHSLANWSPTELPDQSPIIKDTLALIEMCHQQQFQWQEQMLNLQITVTEVQDKLCHLLVFKQQLDEVTWPEPDHLTGLALQWYTHDLLVSLGLSYLLQTGMQLFKGFCDDNDLPSQAVISPYAIRPVLLHLPGFNGSFPEFTWVRCTIEYQPPLLTALSQLQQMLEKKSCPQLFITASQGSIGHLSAHLPKQLSQEHFYYHELIKVSTHESSCEPSLVFLRKLLLLNLTLFNPDTELIIQLHCFYRGMLEEQLNTSEEWEAEAHYWQTHYLLYKETMPATLNHKPSCLQWMDNLRQFCMKKADIDLSRNSTPFTPIDWGTTPKDFVHVFHPLRINQTITLNGNNDIGPLCEKLYQMFRIPKVKGDGYLSLASLVTYFKNMNCGDY